MKYRLELTEKEKIEKAKKEKIILHDNTRLTRTPWKQDDKIRKEVENREAMEAGEEIDEVVPKNLSIYHLSRQSRC